MTCHDDQDPFPDFLSEMLNAHIISSFYATGFFSRMPYPLAWAC